MYIADGATASYVRHEMLTILLSKVLGIFLVLVGASIALRWQYYSSVVRTFVDQGLSRLLTAVAELLAGLFIIFGFDDWSSVPASIIMVFGWAAAIEATAYLLLPDWMLVRYIGLFSHRNWCIGTGLVSMALGAYLAGHGFGLF